MTVIVLLWACCWVVGMALWAAEFDEVDRKVALMCLCMAPVFAAGVFILTGGGKGWRS